MKFLSKALWFLLALLPWNMVSAHPMGGSGASVVLSHRDELMISGFACWLAVIVGLFIWNILASLRAPAERSKGQTGKTQK
jgi:hypothetical protein